MREETLIDVASRDGRRLAIRKAHILRPRGKRHLTPDHAGITNLYRAGSDYMVEAAALEIVGCDGTDAIAVP